jgi:hypothetical protein
MNAVPDAVAALAECLEGLGWVSDLWVAGSLASGDYHPLTSDLDLVAIIDGGISRQKVATLVELHRRLDQTIAAGRRLGCVYVDGDRLADSALAHPTWTHHVLTERILSGITRAELVRHGFAVFGRRPSEVVAPMSDDEVRDAARAELTGYWARAARRPWMWLDAEIAELGLTAMARGRHSLRTGQLMTKREAIEVAAAPAWLVEVLRARRRGETVRLPRVSTAAIAWGDARRTVALARRHVNPVEAVRYPGGDGDLPARTPGPPTRSLCPLRRSIRAPGLAPLRRGRRRGGVSQRHETCLQEAELGGVPSKEAPLAERPGGHFVRTEPDVEA